MNKHSAEECLGRCQIPLTVIAESSKSFVSTFVVVGESHRELENLCLFLKPEDCSYLLHPV